MICSHTHQFSEKLNYLLNTNMNKSDIQNFINSHLNLKRLGKEIKDEKQKRKNLEQNLYKEFKKSGLNSYDLDKFRVYVYDLPAPRLMVYRIKS